MKTKIFVDGNCIVCDMEIAHYKKIAPELFDIIDISDDKFDAAKFNLTAEAVNENMHVITPDGDLKIGVDAFAHIWSRLGEDRSKYQMASRLIKTPVVYPLAQVGYAVFAKIRPLLPKRSR